MLELKRIYWTRRGLRLAIIAVTVWLFASAILSLMPKANVGAGTVPSSGMQIVRGMFDGVGAAVTLPGVFMVVLSIVAVINARDVRRRDPVRRFTRQQRREGMARAGGSVRWRREVKRRQLLSGGTC